MRRRSRLPALAGFLLCAGALAAGFHGERWLPLDVFANLRLHLAAAAFAFLLAVFTPRRRLITIATVMAITVVAVPLLSTRLQQQARSAPAAGGDLGLTIVSFNSWTRNRDWRRIADYLEEQNADIVVLVELDRAKRPLLSALRPVYPWQTHCLTRRGCQLALLSKHPWREARAEPERGGMPPVIWARFGSRLNGLRVFGTHLSRLPHLRHQLRQVRALAGRLAKSPAPTVVAGDFNATPWSLVFRSFERISGLSGITGLRPTWPAVPLALPQLAIDQVFISGGIAPGRIEVGPALGSDHLPLRSELVVRAGRS